jgi:hypothetical protein
MSKARKVSKAELKDNNETYAGCVFLEPRLWLDSAILGKDASTGGIIYDKRTVVECFVAKDGLSYEQAEEMVDFNTERSLAYMPSPQPILKDIEEEYLDEPTGWGDIWTEDDE